MTVIRWLKLSLSIIEPALLRINVKSKERKEIGIMIIRNCLVFPNRVVTLEQLVKLIRSIIQMS